MPSRAASSPVRKACRAATCSAPTGTVTAAGGKWSGQPLVGEFARIREKGVQPGGVKLLAVDQRSQQDDLRAALRGAVQVADRLVGVDGADHPLGSPRVDLIGVPGDMGPHPPNELSDAF